MADLGYVTTILQCPDPSTRLNKGPLIMAATDVLTLRAVGRYQSQNIVNTMHYQIVNQDSNDQEICEQLIDGWDTANRVLWIGRHIDSYTLVGLKCFRKTGTAKTPAFKLITANGSVTGDEVPSPICRTVTLYTADNKPRRRGRIMLSGSEAAMFNTTDGAVTAAEIALLETMMATLSATITEGTDEFELCIPASNGDAVQHITDYKARVTPSVITSRRIRQFLIG